MTKRAFKIPVRGAAKKKTVVSKRINSGDAYRAPPKKKGK